MKQAKQQTALLSSY